MCDEYKQDEDPAKWTVNDVKRWFQSDRQWRRYSDNIWEEAIDGRELSDMTITTLANIGVKKNDRPDLLREIRALFAESPGKLENNASFLSDDMVDRERDEERGEFDFPCFFEVLADKLKVRETSDLNSKLVAKLDWSTKIKVVQQKGRRMKISEPKRGWVSYKTSAGKQMISKITYGGDSDSVSDWDDGEETIQTISDKRRQRRGGEGELDSVKKRVKSLRRLTSSRRLLRRDNLSDDEEIRNMKGDCQVLKVQTKMSENELESLKYNLDIANGEVNELKNQIQDKDQEVEELKDKLRDRRLNDDEYDERRLDLEDAKKVRETLIDEKISSEDKVRGLEQKVDSLKEELANYKRKLKKDENGSSFKKTRRYSDDSIEDRPRRYSAERSPSPPKNRRKRASSLDAAPRKRRYSSDDLDAETGRTRTKGASPRDPPREVYKSDYGSERANLDTYDEDFEERDRYDTPSKMKSSSDADFDEDWSSSKRNNSPAPPRQSWRDREVDESTLTGAEKRAKRIGKEDHGWFVKYDSKGKPYFFNSVTGSERTDKPGCLLADCRLGNPDPVILCEYDGIWYKAQLLDPHMSEFWWVRFDCGNVKKASIHRDHIRKWVAWLEETDEY